MAASKPTDGQTDVDMRLCNVVLLVWGSLGLTLLWPFVLPCHSHNYFYLSQTHV